MSESYIKYVATNETKQLTKNFQDFKRNGAGEGVRTLDPKLGRLVLYQLSYTRLFWSSHHTENGGAGWIRTIEGILRQIYSLLPLAAREPRHGAAHRT